MRAILTLMSLLLVVACTGEIADAPLIDGEPAPLPNPDEVIEAPCPEGEVCIGTSRLQRITATQYRRTVRRVLGSNIVVEDGLIPEDHRAEGFTSNEGVDIGERDVAVYARLAGQVALQAIPENFVDCEAGLDCALETVRNLALGLYRRPILAEEEAAFEEYLIWLLEEDTFDTAIVDIVEMMLQSPHFLFQVEQGGASPARLSGNEVATRLAHFLFREGPDEELLIAAAAGELDTSEGVVAWATRMVADVRADATIRQFHREWLGVDQIGYIDRTAQGLPPELAQDMRRESEIFARELVRDGGSFRDLLTAQWSMLNPSLAAHYGQEVTGESFQRTEMSQRAGILTLGGVLTVHGSPTFTAPVFRGLLVRERLLCQHLPEAPDGALELAAERALEVQENQTEREKLDAITMTPGCEGCHVLMNPIGHALAAFDDVGRFRMTDASGSLVDIAGEIRGGSMHETDVDGNLVGAHELGERLADSELVSRCYARQWFRYGLQRADFAADSGSIDAAHAAFVAADLNIEALMIALTTTDSFLHRRIVE